jgi:hypothetical protein
LGDNATQSLLTPAEEQLSNFLEKERYATHDWNFSR